ncbi:putative glucosamine 6-phosphate N-acetyltransferase 1 [Stipitochalara longipes BDJ]|nr:putative glucosamine 6-phosphate N-acetyltransferase 1 [Stipitochalara longipes BDJ]
MELQASLFSPSLIPPPIHFSLPEGFICRPLQRSDFRYRHLDVLRDLAHVGDITEEQWIERFDDMKQCNGTYFILVFVDQRKEAEPMVIGTGTLMIEKKFLCSLGKQGHIEDVAIAKDYQGKKLGMLMIEALDKISEQVGSYKTILDCRPEKEGFYLKCGYERRGLEMHHYHGSVAQNHSV